MKKMLRIPMTLLLIFLLVGCGTNNKDNNDTVNNDQDANVDTNTTDEHVNEDHADNNTGNNTNNNASNDMNATGDNKIEVADQVADDVATMEEVESANVLVTNANAYVAVVLKEGTEGTKEIENKIAEHVRKGNQDFNNVYVSMNPDFVEQMTDYGNKVREGEPVEGFFEEFTDAVQRVFPDAH